MITDNASANHWLVGRAATSILALLVLLVASNCAVGQDAAKLQKVELPNTQLIHMNSAIVGRPYDIQVQLPGNYSDTTRYYPVIYVLDGQWDFPLVISLYGQQYFDGFIPASIVVGIAWGGAHPNYDSLRAGDLSPTFNKQVPQSGNGEKFFSFITQELIPKIDSSYRTRPHDRTLMGSSFGGLFTLYAMFRQSASFNRFILTSPYLGFDNDVIYRFEKEFAHQNKGLPVRLFMAEGGLEGGQGDFDKFVELMKSQDLKNVSLETRIVEGAGHSGAKAEGFTRGLQSVFARPSLRLDPSLLDQYVGTYEIGPTMQIVLSRRGDQLVGTVPGGTSEVLHAETDDDFYVLGQFLNLHFKKDNSGKVTGFEMERYGGKGFIKRIK